MYLGLTEMTQLSYNEDMKLNIWSLDKMYLQRLHEEEESLKKHQREGQELWILKLFLEEFATIKVFLCVRWSNSKQHGFMVVTDGHRWWRRSFRVLGEKRQEKRLLPQDVFVAYKTHLGEILLAWESWPNYNSTGQFLWKSLL